MRVCVALAQTDANSLFLCVQPQPQILNCIVHFFENKFDPFGGAPVDRTAKWIAPLYDRVAFYETVLGLQLLDVPTMVHDAQVEPEDVSMYDAPSCWHLVDARVLAWRN